MIAVLGINHKTASVHIRESLYISTEKVGPLADEIIQKTDVQEILIFSTCNRTEVYFYTRGTCHKKESGIIIDVLHEYLGCREKYTDAFYTYHKKAAVKHLFRVTSGLDSMLIGEVQIVSQVKEAYLLCTRLALTDAVLMRLFQKAFEVSKRVRSETNIQKGSTSISYVAIEFCVSKLGDISDKNILLIGTGETGQIALSHIKKRGGRNFIISNRTFNSAECLARKVGGKAVPFDRFREHIPLCDIIITATDAGRQIISFSDVDNHTSNNPGMAQMFIDLSVPRNIDESVGKLNSVTLLGVDDLQMVTGRTTKIRIESMDKAEKLIEQMAEEFNEWYNHRKLRAIIKTITAGIQHVHEQELSISEKCYSPEEFSLIREYSGRLSQKYARLLIKRLKKLSNGNQDSAALKKLRDLFEINEG
jgi:glutamyl-tRNA reductase